MQKIKFIFYGKILGFYYELNKDNSDKLSNSLILPASTVKQFKINAKKTYKNYKIIFNKVG